MGRRLWIGLATSALFLFLALRRVDVRELGTALQTARYWRVIPAVLLTLLAFWIRAVRWRYLLEPVKLIPLRSLFAAVMIGFMANNLLPAKLGEFVRAYTIARREKISKSASLATVVVARVFDGLVVFLLLAVPLFLHPTPGLIRKTMYVAFVVYAAALAFLWFLKYRTERTITWTQRALSHMPRRWSHRACGMLRAFVAGLQVMHNAGNLCVAVLLTVAVWLCMAGAVYVVLVSCGLSVPTYAAFLILGAIALGFSLPSSPGAVGSVEFFSVSGLALFGVPTGRAMAFSIIYHATQYVPVTLIGLVYLWSEHLSLKAIRQVRD